MMLQQRTTKELIWYLRNLQNKMKQTHEENKTRLALEPELEEEEEMTAAPLGPARWRVLVAAREGWWTQLKCWAPRG